MMMAVEILCGLSSRHSLSHPEPGLLGEKTQREITTETGPGWPGARQQGWVWSVTTINCAGEKRDKFTTPNLVDIEQEIFLKIIYPHQVFLSIIFTSVQANKAWLKHLINACFLIVHISIKSNKNMTTNIISNLSSLHFWVLNTWKVFTIFLHLFAAQLTSVSDEEETRNFCLNIWLHGAYKQCFQLFTIIQAIAYLVVLHSPC